MSGISKDLSRILGKFGADPFRDDSRVKHPILFCLVQGILFPLASKQRLGNLDLKCVCRPLQRVDLEKRRAEKERAEKGHVPSGIPTSSLSTFPSI
ncbi:hypothetical protein L3X38_010425 [Prunus dulcis]|uniref:Uncharacterized protein n=1 Tax=Prunus dulcis TaxID=3755 RepID=A0AAD4ZE08_PRUDU|nr:hypothetical protein L3X38_010425 [Prunus dulcis]